jgi:hypothetical protein
LIHRARAGLHAAAQRRVEIERRVVRDDDRIVRRDDDV